MEVTARRHRKGGGRRRGREEGGGCLIGGRRKEGRDARWQEAAGGGRVKEWLEEVSKKPCRVGE